MSGLVNAEELELLREDAQARIDSFAYPKGTPDRKQPTEWHEGRKLLALADRLAQSMSDPITLKPEYLNLERLTRAQRRDICAAAVRDATDNARPVGQYPLMERALWKAADAQWRKGHPPTCPPTRQGARRAGKRRK